MGPAGNIIQNVLQVLNTDPGSGGGGGGLDDGLWHDASYFSGDDGLWHDDSYFSGDDGLWHDAAYF